MVGIGLGAEGGIKARGRLLCSQCRIGFLQGYTEPREVWGVPLGTRKSPGVGMGGAGGLAQPLMEHVACGKCLCFSGQW